MAGRKRVASPPKDDTTTSPDPSSNTSTPSPAPSSPSSGTTPSQQTAVSTPPATPGNPAIVLATPAEQARIRALAVKIHNSALYIAAASNRKLYFEKTGKGVPGGMGMIMEDGEPAQFILNGKLVSSFLTLRPESIYPTYSITLAKSGADATEYDAALPLFKNAIDNIDVNRDIRWKLYWDRVFFNAVASKTDVEAAKSASENLDFAEIRDGRDSTELNDLPLLKDRKALQGSPDVAVVFSARVWKGDTIAPFVGGPSGKPKDKDGWSVSFSIISIIVLGSSGGGKAEAMPTPKKAKRI